MSHRRKNAHPTMKNKRINLTNGEDRSLSDIHVESSDEHSGNDTNKEEKDKNGQMIAIPPDLADDFEKLKHITKLDSHALMRNLLKDYQRLSEDVASNQHEQDSAPEDEVKSIGSVQSQGKAETNNNDAELQIDESADTRSINDDVDAVSLAYRKADSPDDVDAVSLAYRKADSPEKSRVEISFDEPLDLSVMKDEYNKQVESDGRDSSRSSPMVPKTVVNIMETENVGPSPVPVQIESPEQPSNIAVPRIAAPFDISKLIAQQFDLSKLMALDPSKVGQQPPDLSKMDLSKISASFIPLSLPQASSGCSMVFYPFPVTTASANSQSVMPPNGSQLGITTNAARPNIEQTTTVSSSAPDVIQAQRVEQLPKPPYHHRRGPGKNGRKEVSIGSRSKQNKTNSQKTGNMRVVYENTTLPGVYTSILKLPWSRRSRHKVHPAHNQQQNRGQHKNMHCQQQSIAPTNGTSSQLFLSTTSKDPAFLGRPEDIKIDDDIHVSRSNDSMMMVYRNSSLTSTDRPKRRGRPPKLPVLANLLGDKQAQAAQAKEHRDVMAASRAQTDNGLLSHSAPSMVPPRAEIILNDPMISQGSPIQNFLQSHSDNLNGSPYNITDVGTPTVLSPSRDELSDNPQTVKHVFNIGKDQTASRAENVSSTGPDGMYHEMVLSSKSLVTAKPRKRNFPSELLKPNDNFLCTSFRFRPRKRRSSGDNASYAQQAPTYAQQAPTFMEPLTDASQQKGSRDSHEQIDNSNVDGHVIPQMKRNKKSRHMFHELFHCKICNDIISGEDKSDHEKLHLGKLLICQNCEDEFECSTLEESSTTDHCLCPKCRDLQDQGSVKRPARGVVCDLCQERLKTYFEYCIHLERVHEIAINFEDEHYVCNLCGKVTYSEDDREAHKTAHSGYEIECTFQNCDERFVSSVDLERHILEEHETDKAWECVYDGCDKQFDKNAELQEHIRLRHSNGYHCPWPGCDMEFTTHRALKVHTLIHTDEKPLKCEFCEYRCRQRNALNWHMRKHPEAPYRYKKFSMMTQDG